MSNEYYRLIIKYNIRKYGIHIYVQGESKVYRCGIDKNRTREKKIPLTHTSRNRRRIFVTSTLLTER
jgi:hypothetical protein